MRMVLLLQLVKRLVGMLRTASGFIAGVGVVEQPNIMRRLPKISPTLSVILIILFTIKPDQPTALTAACQSKGPTDPLMDEFAGPWSPLEIRPRDGQKLG